MSSVKIRVERLEQRQSTGLPTVGRVIVRPGDEDQAEEARWLAENPGQPLPELLVVRMNLSLLSKHH